MEKENKKISAILDNKEKLKTIEEDIKNFNDF